MDNKKIMIFIICLVLVAGFIYFVVVEKNGQNLPQSEMQNKSFGSRINDEGGLSIEVTPLNFEAGKTISFQITLDTHQGNLNFDMTKITVLKDDMGNEYQTLEWQGGSGGHHLSGILVFSPLPAKTKSIKLVIKDVYGIPERTFEWDLN